MRVSSLFTQEWWTDPAQCSDFCGQWRRTWNPDWDGRAPPNGEKMKAVGAIRHLRLGLFMVPWWYRGTLPGRCFLGFAKWKATMVWKG